MITYKDTNSVPLVRLAEIPDLIRSRRAFDTAQHRMYAFNDALGNYGVYSYGKPVLIISPHGARRYEKGYIFKNHREVLSSFLV